MTNDEAKLVCLNCNEIIAHYDIEAVRRDFPELVAWNEKPPDDSGLDWQVGLPAIPLRYYKFIEPAPCKCKRLKGKT